MNDLEAKLRALAFREPPPGLRRDVLAAAEVDHSAATPDPEPVRWTWRDWLWPSPLAWGALAATLTGAAILQSAVDSPAFSRPSSPVAAQPPEAHPQTIYAYYALEADPTWMDGRQ